jgi:hypothetical protein
MGVNIELLRKHPRAPVHAVAIGWWAKGPEDFQSAIQERNRSKVGRMARLRREAETITPGKAEMLEALDAEL